MNYCSVDGDRFTAECISGFDKSECRYREIGRGGKKKKKKRYSYVSKRNWRNVNT